MTLFVEENERIKHDYATYLRHAKGQDDTSIDKARAAIRRFEDSTNFKPFKKFHRQQAADFKAHLDRQKTAKTGIHTINGVPMPHHSPVQGLSFRDKKSLATPSSQWMTCGMRSSRST